jgi:hypothetical protein
MQPHKNKPMFPLQLMWFILTCGEKKLLRHICTVITKKYVSRHWVWSYLSYWAFAGTHAHRIMFFTSPCSSAEMCMDDFTALPKWTVWLGHPRFQHRGSRLQFCFLGHWHIHVKGTVQRILIEVDTMLK